MPLVEWSHEYATGDAIVDLQHQALFRMVNELHDAIVENRTQEVLGGILDGLERYVVEHFDAEARLMEATNYPGRAAHRSQHDVLTARAREVIEHHRAGKLLLGATVSQFLGRWLTVHILMEDKRMIQWVRAHLGPEALAARTGGDVPLAAQLSGGGSGDKSESRLLAAAADMRGSVDRLAADTGKR